WNLEINSLHKLSEELAPRGTRVSDGSQEEAIDQRARRRQQFKDGKRRSSAGGRSLASSITEGLSTQKMAVLWILAFELILRKKDSTRRISIQWHGFSKAMRGILSTVPDVLLKSPSQ
ncbi:hypothetical protein MC885_014616, partial [Smutsia gigantea]